ncbi:hypothetical protein N0V83_006818 [Neocucurbitaria cava]|uniref:Uncharacterized protein n=1 Tax=Neocucurbitaria cava TaxID=798079 RepID=A0A9W9CLC4_9PLEO|nr:hypothetical protein N0V83_006818 [Neocucurbitaria cava]
MTTLQLSPHLLVGMSATDIAIFDGTLGDAESLAELHKRKDIFVADRELMPDLQSRGLATFNTAVDTDIPSAMSSGQPVVSFLKRVLITIGALYKEQEQRDLDVDAESTGGESESNQNASVQEHRVDPWLDTNRSTANTKQNTEHIDLDENQLSPSRLDAAVAARKKRKLLTHGNRRKVEMVPPVAKIDNIDMPQHMDNVANGLPTASELPLTGTRAFNSKRHQQPSQTRNPARGVGSKQAPPKQTSMKHSTKGDGRPSLIVKLKVPRQFLALHQVDNMTPSKPRRKRRGKYKSAEFVASDTEASDAEMCDTPFNDLNSKKRKRGSTAHTSHSPNAANIKARKCSQQRLSKIRALGNSLQHLSLLLQHLL